MRPREVPTRTCVGCRTPRPKPELERIVRTPDGRVVLDPTGRQPGRGAYVCADPACRRLASTKRALERALETPIPPALLEMLAAGAPTQIDTEGGARGQE